MEHRCRRGQQRWNIVVVTAAGRPADSRARGETGGAHGAYGKAVAKLAMTTVPRAKTSRAGAGGWLIVISCSGLPSAWRPPPRARCRLPRPRLRSRPRLRPPGLCLAASEADPSPARPGDPTGEGWHPRGSPRHRPNREKEHDQAGLPADQAAPEHRHHGSRRPRQDHAHGGHHQGARRARDGVVRAVRPHRPGAGRDAPAASPSTSRTSSTRPRPGITRTWTCPVTPAT